MLFLMPNQQCQSTKSKWPLTQFHLESDIYLVCACVCSGVGGKAGVSQGKTSTTSVRKQAVQNTAGRSGHSTHSVGRVCVYSTMYPKHRTEENKAENQAWHCSAHIWEFVQC